MAYKFGGERPTRRYVRVAGPFDGRLLGSHETPVLIYDLNLGGGFVNFSDDPPEETTLALTIELPHQAPITVSAETVYRHQFGCAVRFVDVDDETRSRLIRTVEASLRRQPGI